MSRYLQVIARREIQVVRVADFPDRDAGPELRRLRRAGALLRVANGYYALVPEANREPNTRWRPTIEAVALGIAAAEYGRDRVALIGPSAARLHGAYSRALATAVIAVPKQRPAKKTVAGSVKFVLRELGNFDLVRATTELGSGWMTSVEETLLDLVGNWPRWPVSEAACSEMTRLLAARASTDILREIGSKPRRGAALARALELLDDPH